MKIGERLIIRSSNISSDRILGTIQRDVARRHGIIIIPDRQSQRPDIGSGSAAKGEKPTPRPVSAG